jgi:hypothetical protein
MNVRRSTRLIYPPYSEPTQPQITPSLHFRAAVGSDDPASAFEVVA